MSSALGLRCALLSVQRHYTRTSSMHFNTTGSTLCVMTALLFAVVFYVCAVATDNSFQHVTIAVVVNTDICREGEQSQETYSNMQNRTCNTHKQP
jgi:multisubunit Na+/H+ antiporter MnhG subunit